MKHVLIFVLSAFAAAVSQQSFAENYSWPNQAHSCVVDSTSQVPTDTTTRSDWTDAPESFSIRLSSCPDYRAIEKMEGERHPNVFRRLHLCDQHGERENLFQVVELFPRFVGVVPPIVPKRLKKNALASDNGVMFRLHSNGSIDVGWLPRENNSNVNAWRLVRATCLPSDSK